MALTQTEAQNLQQEWTDEVQPAIDAITATVATAASGGGTSQFQLAQQALVLVQAVSKWGLNVNFLSAG